MDKETLELKVNEFIHTAPDTAWFGSNNERLFEHISVGRQSSDHPIFNRIIDLHKDHLHPEDFLGGRHDIHGTVLSFVFHFNRNIVKDNSKENLHPSFLWYEIRHKFDGIAPLFIAFVKDLLHPREITVPGLTGKYATVMKNGTLTSNWSERHIAYTCGLGSFGLHSALITDRGCTHRLLSMIVNGECPATEINETDIRHNCLYFTNGGCGTCMTKCPVGAIQNGIHDLTKCYGHEMITNKIKSLELYGPEVAACGLCMCGVPCDTKKP
jgi:epoxyqueuosine reductase